MKEITVSNLTGEAVELVYEVNGTQHTTMVFAGRMRLPKGAKVVSAPSNLSIGGALPEGNITVEEPEIETGSGNNDQDTGKPTGGPDKKKG